MTTKSLTKTQASLLERLNKFTAMPNSGKQMSISKTTKDGRKWRNSREYDAAIALVEMGKAVKVREDVFNGSRYTQKTIFITLGG